MEKKQIKDSDLDFEPKPTKRAIKKATEKIFEEEPTVAQEPEEFNPLRNERVIIRHINKKSDITDRRHIMFGGMHRDAKKTYCVPMTRGGKLKNVLTNKEMEFFENLFGMEKGAMSVYRKLEDNYWTDDKISVTLKKEDNVLDLSSPQEYIKYKILLANTDYICPSLQALEDFPKATYDFVIIEPNEEATREAIITDTTAKCYLYYGQMSGDAFKMRKVIEIMESRTISPAITMDNLKKSINDCIQTDPRRFVHVCEDESLPSKILIMRCVDNGLISRKSNLYFIRDTNTPMCDYGQESTLNVAARWLDKPANQDLKFSLEAKL